MNSYTMLVTCLASPVTSDSNNVLFEWQSADLKQLDRSF